MTMTLEPDQTGPTDSTSMVQLLEALRPEPGAEGISIEEVMDRIGGHSFGAALFIIGLLVVSPLSAIPGLPAVFALIVLLIAGQAILGRHRLWLPRWLARQSVGADKMETTLSKLSKAADWIDRHSKARFSLLLAIPFRWMIYVVIISVAISWPPLSLVPLSATTTAIGLTFLSAGLVLRDGLYVLFGYVVLVLIYGGFALLFSGLV